MNCNGNKGIHQKIKNLFSKGTVSSNELKNEESNVNSIPIDQLTSEIKARTKMTAYSLVINKDKKPGIFDSKFGGVPYWDVNKEYPTDSDGNMLALLAQINLDNMEEDDRLPGQGMLQFYIGADELYGFDFDNLPDNQNKFRVVYHEKVNYDIMKEQVLNIHMPVSNDLKNNGGTPVLKECVVDIIRTEIYMGECDYRFETVFRNIAEEKFGYDIGEQPCCRILGDEDYEDMIEVLKNDGHWLLGYPHFTQYDPREYGNGYDYYDTLLFQMDSDYIDDEYYTIWGDCGVGNFFINGGDLKKRDFSKVLYTWDCG